ncbi:hypothetical protein DIPPA_12282 [Diplonema papillatum]|nr:hypothetical protein DIPPA_12282 [Diplonema papillatum]
MLPNFVQGRWFSGTALRLAKRTPQRIPLNHDLSPVESRTYRPLDDARRETLLEREGLDSASVARRRTRDTRLDQEATEQQQRATEAVQAELVTEVAGRAPPVVLDDSEYLERAGFEPLPTSLPRVALDAIILFRVRWQRYGKATLEGYPAEFEELLVNALLGDPIEAEELFCALINGFTVPDSFRPKLEIFREVDIRDKKVNYAVVSKKLALEFNDAIEGGLRAKVFTPRLAQPLCRWLLMPLGLQNVSLDRRCVELILRILARHSPSSAKKFYRKYAHSSVDPTSLNVLLRSMSYPWPGLEHEDTLHRSRELVKELNLRQVPIDGNVLEGLVKSWQPVKPPLSILNAITRTLEQAPLNQSGRVVFSAAMWTHCIRTLADVGKPGKAFELYKKLRMRLLEEWPDTKGVVPAYLGHPSSQGTRGSSDKPWPVLGGTGRMSCGLLPTRLSPNVILTMLQVASTVKFGLPLLEELYGDYVRLGYPQNHACFSPFIKWYASFGTLDQALQFIKESVVPAGVGIQNDAVGYLADGIIKRIRKLKQERKPGEAKRLASDALGDLLYILEDTPRPRIPMPALQCTILRKLFRIATMAEKVGPALEVYRLLKYATKAEMAAAKTPKSHEDAAPEHRISATDVYKLLTVASKNGNWRVGESAVFEALQDSELGNELNGGASGSAWFKIHTMLLGAHLHRKSRLDPLSHRALRALELCVQIFLRGSVLTYAITVEIIRICLARVQVSGDVPVIIQNNNFFPIGVEPRVLLSSDPPLKRMSWGADELNAVVVYQSEQRLAMWEIERKTLVGKGSRMTLSEIVAEAFKHAVSRRSLISDDLLLHFLAFWLVGGWPEAVPETLLPLLKKTSEDQARCIDLLLQCCEVAGVEPTRDALMPITNLRDAHGKFQLLLDSSPAKSASA